MPDKDDDELFEDIIEATELKKWFEEAHPHQLTIGDVYEGVAIVASMQVELNQYLKDVVTAIYNNNQRGEIVDETPKLTTKQIVHLMTIFESAAEFLEEFDN